MVISVVFCMFTRGYFTVGNPPNRPVERDVRGFWTLLICFFLRQMGRLELVKGLWFGWTILLICSYLLVIWVIWLNPIAITDYGSIVGSDLDLLGDVAYFFPWDRLSQRRNPRNWELYVKYNYGLKNQQETACWFRYFFPFFCQFGFPNNGIRAWTGSPSVSLVHALGFWRGYFLWVTPTTFDHQKRVKPGDFPTDAGSRRDLF